MATQDDNHDPAEDALAAIVAALNEAERSIEQHSVDPFGRGRVFRSLSEARDVVEHTQSEETAARATAALISIEEALARTDDELRVGALRDSDVMPLVRSKTSLADARQQLPQPRIEISTGKRSIDPVDVTLSAAALTMAAFTFIGAVAALCLGRPVGVLGLVPALGVGLGLTYVFRGRLRSSATARAI